MQLSQGWHSIIWQQQQQQCCCNLLVHRMLHPLTLVVVVAA